MIKIEPVDGKDIESVLAMSIKEELDKIEKGLLELELKHPIKEGRAIPKMKIKR